MDRRHPLDEILHVYDLDEYREALSKYDSFDVISLDYDLNDFTEIHNHRSYIGDSEGNGRDACGYLIKFLHKSPEEILIHSSNTDGSIEMMLFLYSRGVASRRVVFNDNPDQ
jgi:hypothetical protein